MTFLLATTIKVSAVILIALAVALVLRRASAALRHWVLAVGLLCAALMPLLSVALPTWHMPLAGLSKLLVADVDVPRPGTALTLMASPHTAVSDDESLATTPRSGRTLDGVAIIVWLTGTVVSTGVLVIALWRLRRLASQSSPMHSRVWRDVAGEIARTYGVRDDVRLLQSAHATMLVTWGFLSPRILVPAGAHQWSEARVRVVLCHELAHVRRADWALMLAAALIRCVYWFNPLVWIACRSMRHEGERACDDVVMRTGISGADYAAHLLAIAREAVRGQSWSPAAAVAHPSALEERIRAMLNRRQNREPITGVRRAAAAAAMVAVVVPIAAASGSSSPASVPRDLPRDVRPASIVAAPPRAAPTPAASVLAQAGTGSITAVFYDQLGGLLPGVRVVMSGAQGPVRQAITDSAGSSTFAQLRPGTYAMEASLPGFQNRSRRFEITADEHVSQTITMALGSVEETVTVTGGPPDQEQVARLARVTTAEFLAELAKVRGRQSAPTSRITSPCAGAVGGCVRPPKMVARANPIYPAPLQAAGTQGSVRVTAQIGVNGLLTNLHAVGDDQDLIDATLQALTQWEFEPTYLNGVPVETNILITVEFRL